MQSQVKIHLVDFSQRILQASLYLSIYVKRKNTGTCKNLKPWFWPPAFFAIFTIFLRFKWFLFVGCNLKAYQDESP